MQWKGLKCESRFYLGFTVQNLKCAKTNVTVVTTTDLSLKGIRNGFIYSRFIRGGLSVCVSEPSTT